MRQYTHEFHQPAVNVVLVDGASVRKGAASLGIPFHTIHNWVASARRGRGALSAPAATDSAGRLRELDAENRMLRIERDILKTRL